MHATRCAPLQAGQCGVVLRAVARLPAAAPWMHSACCGTSWCWQQGLVDLSAGAGLPQCLLLLRGTPEMFFMCATITRHLLTSLAD